MITPKTEWKKEPWHKRSHEELSIAELSAMSPSTLLIMRVSALRGIVDTEQAISMSTEHLSKLYAQRRDIEFTEKTISKVLDLKKQESDWAVYLRTGRFPDGN